MGNSITITGVTGFVGQNLKEYLRDSFDIKGLSRRQSDGLISYESFVKDKIPCEAIIHLAGKAHDTANVSDPQEYFEVNTELTIELFNVFLESDIKDFFYFSSVKAVADTVTGILTEDEPANPLTPYGKSKYEAEKYLLSQDLPQGKRVFIIRPCMIHGPGNKGNLNLLYKIVKYGIPWPLASFENHRSFLSIDNLSFLVASVLKDKTIKGGVYNFADDEVLSTNELIVLMSKTLNRKPGLWKWNKRIISKLAVIGDKLKLPLNTERLKKLTECYIVSNEKIKTALKLEKLPLSASEGLIKTFNSFKTN